MSYAAEPYGVFVDDLLSNLTGGITREQFRYPAEGNTHQLAFRDDHLPATIRIHGIVDRDYHRFLPTKDFKVDAQGTISWLADAEPPAPDALKPDRGSRYYVSYERIPENRPAPALTDRNPGSITRTLAESFAREYAVVAKQLEKVYKAGFLETAEDRDLEQVVALVGIERRGHLNASGEIVASRSTPAAADIYIPAGTLISSADAPPVTVETAEPRTLAAGSLSVAIPVVSTITGQDGVVKADQLTIIHRPILGIESITNPQALRFSSTKESDVRLRQRASRALEGAGASTVGAIVNALTAIEGIRAQDVAVVEDHVNHPGLIKVTVATELSSQKQQQAVDAIESVRPAGIKVLHNLPVPPEAVAVVDGDGGGDPVEEPPAEATSDETIWFPLGLRVRLTLTDLTADGDTKTRIDQAVRQALVTAINDLGIGEAVIYHRLIAHAMAVEGVQDVLIDVYPSGAASGRSNVIVPQSKRARIDDGDLNSGISGALVALDMDVQATRKGRLTLMDADQALSIIRDSVIERIGDLLVTNPALIEQPSLIGALSENDDYKITSLTFQAELVEQGLRILQLDPTLELTAEQQPWLRAVKLSETPATGGTA